MCKTYELGQLIKYGERTYKVTRLYQPTNDEMIKYDLYGKNRVELTNIENIGDIMDFAISHN